MENGVKEVSTALGVGWEYCLMSGFGIPGLKLAPTTSEKKWNPAMEPDVIPSPCPRFGCATSNTPAHQD
eukprot:CAMPEP_0184310502 /NCGR_PEP_ID=MMETSP1049-20130417/31075_1 /TAXON_ID=77928 /ORGANISM="Proteomonas sulcata, Strain CCMP704" /LENGTH=68 /DNA_ID=CAMNT_0026624747 /DNA_START=20 /DNA_END=223 /DNA_ORIENTATION=+